MNVNEVFHEIKNEFGDAIYDDTNSIVITGDSLELLKRIPDNSIALILTDPPYHTTKKKNIIGDTAFKNDEEYLIWLEKYAAEWNRILKPNGCIYCFCSPAMAPRLLMMFSHHFNILSEITWTKPNAPGYDGWRRKMKKESLRQWYPHSEKIIFMERSFEGNLFKSYFGVQLSKWRKSVNMTTIQLAEITKSYGKVNHGGAVANWEAGRNIPSRDQYSKIKKALTDKGVTGIPDFEDIIRPFNVSKNVEFTDVWTFETVKQYKGKHPAEKPIDLLKHAILSSTYENDIVLDCFCGSGNTGIAARECSRKAILIDISEEWSEKASQKLAAFKDVNNK